MKDRVVSESNDIIVKMHKNMINVKEMSVLHGKNGKGDKEK